VCGENGITPSLANRNSVYSSQTEKALLDTSLINQRSAEHLAGAVRTFLEAGGEPNAERYRELVARFIGPFTSVFASWVLEKARQSGVERLYFLSRDGQLTWKAAQTLAPKFGNIDCRYLHVSRQALFLPSSSEISESGMPWLCRHFERPVLGPLLAKLELTYADIAPFFPYAGRDGENYVLKTEEDRRAFWLALNEPALKSRLKKLIEERRTAAHSFFETAGLFEPVKWAVVDFGWFLSCQRSLNVLMQGWGWKGEVCGFYLGVQHGREPPSKTGPAKSVFQLASGESVGMEGRSVFKAVTIIEHLVGAADHPTVHRYGYNPDGSVSPQFRRSVDKMEEERFGVLEQGVVSFAGYCADFASELAEVSTAAELLDLLAADLLFHPEPRMLRPVINMEVSFDQNNLNAMPLLRPLNLREAMAPAFPEWAFLRPLWKKPRILWQQGSLAVSPTLIKAVCFVAKRIRALRVRCKWFR